MKRSPIVAVAFAAFLALPACAQTGSQTAATGTPAPAQAPAPGESAVDDRPGIAVMPFEFGGSIGRNRLDAEGLDVGLQQMLLTEFAQNTNWRVIERNAIRQIMQEQDLVTAGRVDAQTAAQIGKLVGARYMVLGMFLDNDGQMDLTARIVDVETSEVLHARRVQDRRQRLYPMLVDLSAQLTRDVNLPPLPRNELRVRQRRQIPPEAAALYSRALHFQDRGQTERAIELYQRIMNEFPQMTEAREALRQISAG
jgi:TolB-like protein